MTTSERNLDALASIAAETAMRAAATYLQTHNLKVLDYEAATHCLRSWVKSRLPGALDDARQAIEVNMGLAAEQTFRLSMAQAGIEAAKEFGWPADFSEIH